MKANPGMRDPNKIAAGGKLVIPGAKTASAKPAAASSIAPRTGTAVSSSSSLPAMARPSGSAKMTMPSDIAGRNQEQDKAVADVTARGIRNRSASTGVVDPSKFPAPGSAGDARGRATELPKASSTTPPASAPSTPSSTDSTELKGRMITPSERATDTSNVPEPMFKGSKANQRQGTPMPPPGPVNAPAVSGVRDFAAHPPSKMQKEQMAPPGFNRPPVVNPTPVYPGPEGHPAQAGEPDKIITNQKEKKGERVIQTIKPAYPLYESFVEVGENKYRIV